MSTVRIIQNSFVGGELSPALYGRHDIDAYFKGAAEIENMIVLKTGGCRKRFGFTPQHVWTTTNASAYRKTDVRIVPYVYNRTLGGVLIVQDEAVSTNNPTRQTRVTYLAKGTSYEYKDGMPTAVLPNYLYPPSVKWTQVGDTLILSGEKGAVGSNGTAPDPASVSTVLIDHPANTITVGTFAVNPKPTTPYSLSLAAVGDNMIVSDTSSKARTLYYAAYTLKDDVMSDAKKTQIANTNAEWPLNCSILVTVRIYRNSDGTYPDEIIIAKRSGGLYGELARFQDTDYTTKASDDSYRTYQFSDENVIPGDLIYKQTPIFDEGTTVASICTAVFQQRLVFAGLNDEPFSLAWSGAGNLHAFHADRPVANDDPFRTTLAADTPAVIRHALAYRDGQLLFTDSGVWRCYGSITEGFGPNTCRVDRINDIGCDGTLRPIQTTNGVVFVGADSRTVYELNYDMATDSIEPVERSILASHLTEGRTIVSMTHQRYPESVIWFVLDNGTVLSLTCQPEHNVYAWARHAVANIASSIVQILAPGTVTGQNSDLIILTESLLSGKTRPQVYFYTPDTYYDVSDTYPVASTLITLRPELPQQNVQGIPKNILDCLVRVRNTSSVAVRPNGDGVDAVTIVPDSGNAYTGDLKIVSRGAINDDGQMVITSPSGPCEIQEVVWKTDF